MKNLMDKTIEDVVNEALEEILPRCNDPKVIKAVVEVSITRHLEAKMAIALACQDMFDDTTIREFVKKGA